MEDHTPNDLLQDQGETPSEFRTDDGDEFITDSQAAVLTGVTLRSIQRWREKARKSEPHYFRLFFRRESLPNGGFRNRVSKREVLKRFEGKTGEITVEEKDKTSEKMRKEVVEMYKSAIASLERERELLVKELEEKNQQIRMLEEARMRSDILLQQTNDRVKKLESPEVIQKRRWFFWGKRD